MGGWEWIGHNGHHGGAHWVGKGAVGGGGLRKTINYIERERDR